MGLVVQLVYMTSVFSATASNILMTSESSIALDSLTFFFFTSVHMEWERVDLRMMFCIVVWAIRIHLPAS